MNRKLEMVVDFVDKGYEVKGNEEEIVAAARSVGSRGRVSDGVSAAGGCGCAGEPDPEPFG